MAVITLFSHRRTNLNSSICNIHAWPDSPPIDYWQKILKVFVDLLCGFKDHQKVYNTVYTVCTFIAKNYFLSICLVFRYKYLILPKSRYIYLSKMTLDIYCIVIKRLPELLNST